MVVRVNDPADSLHPSATSKRLARGLHLLSGLEPPIYSREDLLGTDEPEDNRLNRWWRAMGFPENPPNAKAFSDYDIDIAERLEDVADSGLFDDEDIARLARLMGASFSRIAEAQIAMIDAGLKTLPHSKDVRTPSDRMKALIETGDPELMAILEESMVYVWKRHLLAAFGRWVGADDTGTRQAIGFMDMVDFSKLSRSMTAAELANLVDSFEAMSFDVVSSFGGRVVKLIGDEVMFVAHDLGVAAEIALTLQDALSVVDSMPAIRCGLAYGPTINVGGDVFGETVNLASRLAQSAKRGTVIVTRTQAELLAESETVEVKKVRRKLGLKGIGNTSIAAIEWPEAQDSSDSVEEDSPAESDESDEVEES